MILIPLSTPPCKLIKGSEMKEFVVLLKDGSRDWVDPVASEESVFENEDNLCVIQDGSGYVYEWDKRKVVRWIVRDYSHETTYNDF